MKKKKIILIISIIVVLLLTIGVSFAAYTYTRVGSNQELVLGDIYMHYNEGNGITLTDAYPSENYDSTKYFEFTISGKNTYTEKDIYYDISLLYGDNISNKTRIEDDLLKFTLVEVKDGKETIVVNNKSYGSLDNKRIYVNTIEKNTTSEVNIKYRLYMWISSDTVIGNVNQDYTMEEWEDVFASIKVKVSGDFEEKIVVSELSTKEFKKMLLNDYSDYVIEEDGITYLSGSASDIDFNYVWYSGKLWRITSIDSNGTMKLITDDIITTISYNSYKNVVFYTNESTNSYMYQWLNQDFLSTLYNYENIIETDAKWYSLTTTDITTKINSTVDGITTYTAPVGLLNSYECYLSYKNTSNSRSYLMTRYYWWLLNPYNSSKLWSVSGISDNNYSSSYTNGTRPSINLKSSVSLTGGDGTKTNPYRIVGDKEDVVVNTTLLNTRMSGEYVKFDEELYRIVSIEKDGTIKLNKSDYIKDTSNKVITKMFASTITFGADGNTQSDDYWDYYLNNTWYNSISSEYKNMMTNGKYYLGEVGFGVSYKNAICSSVSSAVSTSECSKTTSTWKGFVGLPRYGEMFASQFESRMSTQSNMWLITPATASYVSLASFYGYGSSNSPSSTDGACPSINLKSTVKITGGTGLKDDPYEISL